MAGSPLQSPAAQTLAGRTIFITGGVRVAGAPDCPTPSDASAQNSGIGLACSFECAKRGANVAIAARRVDAAQKVVDQIEATYPGVKALAIACDVSVYEQVRDAVAKAVEVFGGVHGAVNSVRLPSVPEPTRAP
jgi:NAD(P)-dependent dehydrogenase (short-subunit alcohol dehydrogenase family)